MNIRTKIALITGASKGIGFAIVTKLLENGYSVIGTSRNGNIADLKNKYLDVLKLDLTDKNSIKQAHEKIIKNYRQIDILINNAGIGPDLGSFKAEENTFDQTIDTNLYGLVFFTEPLLNLVKDNGQILNISSSMGSIGMCVNSDSIAYRVSKSALNMYTKILSNRLIDKNIRVISVHPGWVKTSISKQNEFARLSSKESADGIFDLINKDIGTGTFWNAETQTELPW